MWKESLPRPGAHSLSLVSKPTPLTLLPRFQNANAIGSFRFTSTTIVTIIQHDKTGPYSVPGLKTSPVFHSQLSIHNLGLSHALLPTLPWV